jgi:proteasome accessory factor C
MPPAPATDRLSRLLVMVPWLTARRRVPLDELAAAFGITRAQAEEDVLLVGMLGVPPYTGGCLVEVTLEEDDVVAFPQPYLSRPPTLTPSEGFSLLAAGRALLDVTGAEAEGPLARALAKLATVLGDGRGLAVDLQSPPHLAEVRTAVEEGRTLQIEYYAAWRDEVTERAIEPHVTYQRRGRWYVAAHCHLRGGERRFRIDRIQQLAETGERFEPVRAEPPAGIFDPGDDATDVVVDLPASARWVVEAYPLEWEEADGRLTVHVRLLGTAWLERLLLRVGPDARVVAPPELGDLGAQAARRLLAGYR